MRRHDTACAQLHINIRKEIVVKVDKGHVPESVETNYEDKVTVFCSQQLQTDRTIPNNKLDIIIRDNEKGTCMLIDVAIL